MCYDIDADAVKKAAQFRTKFAFLADTCSQNISSSWLKQLSRPAASCYFMSTSANNYYAKKSVKATADSCPDFCPIGRKIARASMYIVQCPSVQWARSTTASRTTVCTVVCPKNLLCRWFAQHTYYIV